MKVQLAHDLPGHLLVRCGKYTFTREKGYGLENHLLESCGVKECKTNYLNGSISIRYQEPMTKGRLLALLKGLCLKDIEEAVPNQGQLLEATNQDFYQRISGMSLQRLVMKTLLPKPLGLVYLFSRYYPILKSGLESLRKKKLNLEVLDATAIGLALSQKDMKTAGSIMFLLGITELLESYTRTRAKTELLESLALHVEDVWVDREGQELQVPMEELRMEDQVIVRMGSLIPVDGTVIAGQGMVNEASMTGEALPVLKTVGKSVFAGTVLEEGELHLQIRAMASETKLSHIIEQIDHGDSLKAAVQKRSENLADSFVPYNFALVGLTWLLTRNIQKVMALMMVDYSCAIKLSTPIAVISSIKEASERGIVVKGGKFMEGLAQADTIVFDKTGTLTKAQPVVEEILAFEGYTPEEVLKISACLEEHFPHSLARAIVQKAIDEDIHHEEEHSQVEYVLAHGIVSRLHGQRALIGSHHFIVEDEKVQLTEEVEAAIEAQARGRSVIYLALDEKLVGAIFIVDPLREEAYEVVEELRGLGFDHLAMLTGDAQGAADQVAEKLGFDYYQAEVLPEDKTSYVLDQQEQGRSVVMIGDGINDSPALALAHVSVSLKDSSDIAREVADITLLNDNLRQLVESRVLSQKMLARIDQNLKIILGFNSLLMGLGLFGWISPRLTALLHNSSTVLISASSMRPLLTPKEVEAFDQKK